MDFTTEQLEAIDAGEAIVVSLAERSCVVVRQDVFEKISARTGGSLPPETVGALVNQSMAGYDAEDPLLESYQQVE